MVNQNIFFLDNFLLCKHNDLFYCDIPNLYLCLLAYSVEHKLNNLNIILNPDTSLLFTEVESVATDSISSKLRSSRPIS